MEQEKFIRHYGSLYENSPHIALAIYEHQRLDTLSPLEILSLMKDYVTKMDHQSKMKLILEHPELGIKTMNWLDFILQTSFLTFLVIFNLSLFLRHKNFCSVERQCLLWQDKMCVVARQDPCCGKTKCVLWQDKISVVARQDLSCAKT